MAETQPKRPREESQEDSDAQNESEDSKRQKSYNNDEILNFLDEVEEEIEPSHDLTAIFTTLQQELSSSSPSTATNTAAADLEAAEPFQDLAAGSDASAECGGDEDETAKSVIRHLLEASDDELGIPNRREDDDNNNNLETFNPEENFPYNFADDGGLWEIEDEAANYYTVLQSELFM